MGVPHYFSAIKKYFKNAYKNSIDSDYDYMYIDCNYVIHLILSLDTYTNDDDNKVINAFISYIDILLHKTQYKKYGIFFDGCTPYMKFERQRDSRLYYRRFEYKQREWDQNKITYGSPFMYKLINRTYTVFKDSIITSVEKGEAEMSIIRYLQSNNSKTLIVSPDTDFINLCLLHKNANQHIDLLIERGKVQYVYNINYIYSYITSIIGTNKLKDYIFCSFFLGNDFIYQMFDFKFKIDKVDRNMVNIICDAIYKNNENIIVSNNTINITALYKFLNNIPVVCHSYHECYDKYIHRTNKKNIMTKSYIDSMINIYYYYDTTHAVKSIYRFNYIPNIHIVKNYLINLIENNTTTITTKIILDTYPYDDDTRYQQICCFVKDFRNTFAGHGKYYYWDFELPEYARRPILLRIKK